MCQSHERHRQLSRPRGVGDFELDGGEARSGSTRQEGEGNAQMHARPLVQKDWQRAGIHNERRRDTAVEIYMRQMDVMCAH